MKQLIALLMALMMLFSVATVFAGCEDSSKKKSSSSKNDDEDEDDDDENEDEDDGEKKPDGEDATDPDGGKETEGGKNTEPSEPEPPEGTLPADPTEYSIPNALETAVATYYGMFQGNLSECGPDELFDYCEEYFGYTLFNLNRAFSINNENRYEEFTEMVGYDPTVTPELLSCNPMDEDFLDDCAEFLADFYGIDASSVSEGYELEVNMVLSGSDDTKEYVDDTMLAICYEDSWYITYYYDDSYGFGCHFYIMPAINAAVSADAIHAYEIFWDAYYAMDTDHLDLLCPEEITNRGFSMYGDSYTMNEIKSAASDPAYIESWEFDRSIAYWEEQYGENIEFIINDLSFTRLDEEALELFIQGLQEYYYTEFDPQDFSALIKFDGSYTIQGDDDYTEMSLPSHIDHAVCYKGNWYIVYHFVSEEDNINSAYFSGESVIHDIVMFLHYGE